MNSYKTLSALSFLVLACLPGPSARAEGPSMIDVPVRRVFFPPTAYDETTSVQAVIEGELPDPCYTLAKRVLTHDPSSGNITIHQFAWRRKAALCMTGDLLGESPYSQQISLGTLPAGDYGVAFDPDDSHVGYRKLHVGAAPASAQAAVTYAHVVALEVPEVTLDGQDVHVNLSGPFSAADSALKEPVQVEREGDTFVISPVEIDKPQGGLALRRFEQSINLGALPPGEYLVHVWSRGGKAMEKTLTVVHAG